MMEKKDIFIIKDRNRMLELTKSHQERVEVAKSLFGILPKNVDLEKAREDRLVK